MFTVILLLVAGSALALVSQQNLMLVTLAVGPYRLSEIPLFYVIVGSLIVGLLFAYILNLIPSITTFLALRGKDTTIKQKKNEVAELTKRVHQLELENEKIKHTSKAIPTDPDAL